MMVSPSGLAVSPRDFIPPKVMGVLNITPDSFSDGGCFIAPEKALKRAREMVAEGAAIIDVGGESSRPGAKPVALEDELERVLPVIRAIAAELPVSISVDTSKPEVMRAAVAAGATMINDIRALAAEGAVEAVRELGAIVCLMHMQGVPKDMQQSPHYEDVVAEVGAFLEQRVAACVEAGIPRQKILIDPGFGFGKSLAHNLKLLANLGQFVATGVPVLVGISRKSMLGALTGRDAAERDAAGIAAAMIAAEQGVSIIRTHDVAPTVDALKVQTAVRRT